MRQAAAHVIDLDAPIVDNLARIGQATDTPIRDITVTVLDRPRHADMIKEIREAGARIRLIQDGDVAAAIKCGGGQMLCQVWPRTDEERAQLLADGVDLTRIYGMDDLITSNNVSFAATGIAAGELLRGVRYTHTGARTHSVMMRAKTGTVRYIEAVQRWKKPS